MITWSSSTRRVIRISQHPVKQKQTARQPGPYVVRPNRVCTFPTRFFHLSKMSSPPHTFEQQSKENHYYSGPLTPFEIEKKKHEHELFFVFFFAFCLCRYTTMAQRQPWPVCNVCSERIAMDSEQGLCRDCRMLCGYCGGVMFR